MAEILIGTQGWNYPAWVGPFYPEGTRPSEMLPVYGRAFPAVEVDSTFYAIPAEPVSAPPLRRPVARSIPIACTRASPP